MSQQATRRPGRIEVAFFFLVAVMIALISAASIKSCGAPAEAGGARPVIRTTTGLVQGRNTGPQEEYLGIPYAAPPVGALRWRPPQPTAPWHGVRQAASYAPHCPQPASAFGQASMSENCLYLNVFTPPGAARRDLPVVVWLHGGSLLVGESDDYDPRPLVRDGVIVVTFNYRLGALGFLADTALASRPGGSSGDYGLMDQQAALRWVQRDIRAFGGDPGNVTLAGESSGGLSVLAQLVSPGARGLFKRAIAESGTYNLAQRSLAAAETTGAAYAARAGCPGNTASCLRRLPVSAIVDHEDFSGYTPDVDGAVLSRTVKAALASGQFAHVPVIIGTNHDEWRLFIAMARLRGGPPVTAANYQAMIATTLSIPAAAATAVATAYPLRGYSSPSVALGAVGTDAIFACPALAAEDLLSRYTPTYAYEFSDENASQRYLPSVGFPYGAAHESEVQYLFTLRGTPYPGPLSAAQQRLAQTMQRYWTSFAATGVPIAEWPRFTTASTQTVTLSAQGAVIKTGYATEHHCGFWAVAALRHPDVHSLPESPEQIEPTGRTTVMTTTTKLTGVVAEHIRAVNDFDTDAIVATFAEDAYVNDARREIRGIDAIRRWVDKEMVGDSVTIEPVEVLGHYGDTLLRGRYDGTYDRTNLPGELILSNYFSVRDGKIVSLIVIRNQPSEYDQDGK